MCHKAQLCLLVSKSHQHTEAASSLRGGLWSKPCVGHAWLMQGSGVGSEEGGVVGGAGIWLSQTQFLSTFLAVVLPQKVVQV